MMAALEYAFGQLIRTLPAMVIKTWFPSARPRRLWNSPWTLPANGLCRAGLRASCHELL